MSASRCELGGPGRSALLPAKATKSNGGRILGRVFGRGRTLARGAVYDAASQFVQVRSSGPA